MTILRKVCGTKAVVSTIQWFSRSSKATCHEFKGLPNWVLLEASSVRCRSSTGSWPHTTALCSSQLGWKQLELTAEVAGGVFVSKLHLKKKTHKKRSNFLFKWSKLLSLMEAFSFRKASCNSSSWGWQPWPKGLAAMDSNHRWPNPGGFHKETWLVVVNSDQNQHVGYHCVTSFVKDPCKIMVVWFSYAKYLL